MYESQILERKVFKYPPFYRLIKISLRHREKNVVDKSSEEFALEIRKIFGGRILGPEYPLIPRIRNYYSKEFWLKVEKEASITQVKQEIKVLMEKFQASHKQLRISIDVDPV